MELDPYLIPNRLGDDGTSSGRSNGGFKSSFMYFVTGTSRSSARARTHLSDLYGDATL